MQESSLVITGMGAVTPIGTGTDAYWNSLVSGICGIDTITRFPVDDLPVHIAAEVKDFDAQKLIPHSLERNMALFAKYGYVAAREALKDACLEEVDDPARVGIVMGTAMDGMSTLAATQAQLSTGSLHKVGPRLVPMVLGNMTAGILAIDRGFHGPSITVNTACSSGGDAIMTAAMLLNFGEADAILVVGGESILSPVLISSLAAAKALSRRNEDPKAASRPFDRDRDGFVLGEGSGIVVLEELEHAQARGAKIYAELVGYGATADAYHITSPAEDGEGAGMAMKLAMQEAGVQPEQIDYINAHGTSTHHNDLFETKAIKLALGDAAKEVVVNSTKSMIGHLLGAAGGVEFVVCAKSIQDGFIHQTMGTENVDPECDLNYAVGAPVEKDVNYVLTNSLGFGGHNATLLLKKYEG